tara:strand:+ start:813 stop:1058 length:246 start_codon:yes stop_codon:yes gene_type:complete
MTLQQPILQEHFEKFRKDFHSTKVNVQDHWMTYGFYRTPHLAASACCDANKKIEELKLPLVAIHSQGSDTFVVQSNQTPDI